MSKGRILPGIAFVVAVIVMFSSVEAGNLFTRTFGGNGVKGSGDMVTQDHAVKEFKWIETLGAFDVFIKAGKEQKVSITFDDNLIDLIQLEVKKKTLKIYSEESYRSRRACRIEITVPKLEGVTTKGSGDITVENFESDSFECHTKGSGDITIKHLNCEDLRCDIKGSGDITIKNLKGDFLECRIAGSGDFSAEGSVEEVEIDVYGSGDVDTRKLAAKEANVVVKGSGDVKVCAEEGFDGAIYGSGDIYYYGDPEHTSKHVAGSGDIRRR